MAMLDEHLAGGGNDADAEAESTEVAYNKGKKSTSAVDAAFKDLLG